jgi:hypothetical protein
MSFHLLAQIRTAFRKNKATGERYLQLPATQKHILISLLMHANPDGTNIHPSDSELGDFCGLARQAACKNRNLLIEAGWFIIEKGSAGTSKLLSFNVKKLADILGDAFVSFDDFSRFDQLGNPKEPVRLSDRGCTFKRQGVYAKRTQLEPLSGPDQDPLSPSDNGGFEKTNATAKQPIPRKPAKQQNSPLDLSAEEAICSDLVQKLRKLGAYDGVIRKIMKIYSPDKIWGAIEFMAEGLRLGKIGNPGGYMIKYLKDGSKYAKNQPTKTFSVDQQLDKLEAAWQNEPSEENSRKLNQFCEKHPELRIPPEFKAA